jgi:hypothetical protein
MDKNQSGKVLENPKKVYVPQLQVHTALNAGASVESCMQDLKYWQNEYYKKCGWAVPVPY